MARNSDGAYIANSILIRSAHYTYGAGPDGGICRPRPGESADVFYQPSDADDPEVKEVIDYLVGQGFRFMAAPQPYYGHVAARGYHP